MILRSLFYSTCCVLLALLTPFVAADTNRFACLEEVQPFHPGLQHARLTTPQWIGEEGVDAVIILAIDDMRTPQRYESYLRPILERLKKIDGRAPVSIMTNRVDPATPHFQTWLKEGVTIECHTLDHPCPILAGNDFARAKATYDGCVEQLFQIPNNTPVAFRVPCMDSINSPSPRFFAEIFNRTTPGGQFLHIDSSVCNVSTAADPDVPRSLTIDADGRDKFLKYIPFEAFVNTIFNYPYPYVIDRLCWQFPVVVPSDWEAQNLHGNNNPVTVRDWKAQLDISVLKRGTFTMVFHPHGWISNAQVVEFIDYAVEKYGKRVKFLNFREAHEHLRDHLLAGETLRDEQGRDNGVRVMDVNADGYMDVVVANERRQLTRLWLPSAKTWAETEFPVKLVDARGQYTGVRFGVFQVPASAGFVMRNDSTAGAWRFQRDRWARADQFLAGLELDGKPVATQRAGVDQGFRFRDVDQKGTAEALVAGPGGSAVFEWSLEDRRWQRWQHGLPEGTQIADPRGRDAGLRLVDVDCDSNLDVMFSNTRRHSLDLFDPEARGWTRRVFAGERGAGASGDVRKTLPAIAREGTNGHTNNGAWILGRHLWVQNEDTAGMPQLVDRRSFNDLLADVELGPFSADAALETFDVAPGFKVELVAAEPLVRDPVAFDWDTENRLWVVEMIDYPKGVPGGKPGGRVVILTPNREGKYTRSTVFLDGLSFPTGVHPWKRGALITSIPSILYAEDTDGDGRADIRRPLYNGFAHGNEQHLVNNLGWGLDNWLHCANGDSGGVISSVTSGARLNISGRDFRIHPQTGAIEAESGQTQFAKTRDDWGNWFGCSNPTPMFQFVLVDRYIRRNAHAAAPRSARTVVGGGEVFPTSRTVERYNDLHMANRFTSCCGLTIYRDDLFGPHYSGNAFVSEPVHNLVHRMVLSRSGVLFNGRRAAGGERREFVRSSDNWFRPTKLRVGPDGALWIADMYRKVIEHPQYFFTGNFQKLDLRAGDDRGRIYRVVPVRAPQRPLPVLSTLGPAELVEVLNEPSGWRRDKAQELLVLGAQRSAVPRLRELATAAATPQARVHALSALEGLAAAGVPGLDAGLVERALKDRHPGVRRHAIRVSECLPADQIGGGLLSALEALAEDPDAHVRQQLAYTLGELKAEACGKLLAAMAIRSVDLPYEFAAVMSSAVPHLRAMLTAVAARSTTDPNRSGRVIERLLPVVGALGDEGRELRASLLERLLGATEKAPSHDPTRAPWRFGALAGLLGAWKPSAEWMPKLAMVVAEARATALNAKEILALRRSAARLLGAAALVFRRTQPEESKRNLAVLGKLLSPRDAALHEEAVRAIAGARSDDAVAVLLDGWPSYSPALRRRVLDALLERREWHSVTLSALRERTIERGELDAERRRRLIDSKDSAVAKAARAFFAVGGPVDPDRANVIAKYAEAKDLKPNAEQGLAVFENKCMSCHRMAGRGHAVGPDLAALTERSFDGLLATILDPNRSVEERYVQYAVVTRDGRILTGVVSEETGNSLTLMGQDGKTEVVLRKDIARFQRSGVSLMPTGLEIGLSPQDMANLIAFVVQTRAPPKQFTGNQPSLVKAAADGVLRLLSTNAEIRGPTVVFEPRYANLGFWGSEKDRAEWRVTVPHAGLYEATLHWACPKDIAGNGFVLECVDGDRITGKIESTGSWDDYREKTIGKLELKAGTHRLVFRSAGAVRGYLLDLKGVRLKR